MKQVIRIDGNTTNEFSGNVKIRDLEDYLEEIKALGYTHINIIADDGYEEVEFVPYKERLETDEEYEIRIPREPCLKKLDEIHELRELRRLKEKYEK